MNNRIVINSVLALAFLALSFFVHWLFVVPVAWFIWDNQQQILNGVNGTGNDKKVVGKKK